MRQHVSVLRTSISVYWSYRSHLFMSRLWPSMLHYVGQLRSYLCWSGYRGSIQGRHTLALALLLCCKLFDVCLYVGFEYFFVRNPGSEWLLWSHFEYIGSRSSHGQFPVQDTMHGLLPPNLQAGHVEHGLTKRLLLFAFHACCFCCLHSIFLILSRVMTWIIFKTKSNYWNSVPGAIWLKHFICFPKLVRTEMQTRWLMQLIPSSTCD